MFKVFSCVQFFTFIKKQLYQFVLKCLNFNNMLMILCDRISLIYMKMEVFQQSKIHTQNLVLKFFFQN